MVRMNKNMLYMENIVKFHETPMSIVSDPYARFTTRVWKEFQDAIDTELMFSTVFHPQIGGQLE